MNNEDWHEPKRGFSQCRGYGGKMTQPLGRYKTRFPNKTDCHCKKDGEINWWEDTEPNKSKARREAKENIERELEELAEEVINGDEED